MSSSLACCVAISLTALLIVRPALAQIPDDSATCGSWSASGGSLDYRQREASDFNRWRLNDNNTYHYTPAFERMKQGEYSRRVRADIQFLLGTWPNHYPGLELLIRYDLAGGKTFDGLSSECLFSRARRFARGDMNVLFAEGYYYWKTGRRERALLSYQAALNIDSQSADGNYLIGLLYLELDNPEEALRHARIAYANGAQLPGLRKRLEDAQYWRDRESE